MLRMPMPPCKLQSFGKKYRPDRLHKHTVIHTCSCRVAVADFVFPCFCRPFFWWRGWAEPLLPWTRHKEGQDRRLQLEGDFCSEEDRTRGPTAKGASFKRFTMRKHYRAKGAVPLSETVLTIADCSAVPYWQRLLPKLDAVSR